MPTQLKLFSAREPESFAKLEKRSKRLARGQRRQHPTRKQSDCNLRCQNWQ